MTMTGYLICFLADRMKMKKNVSAMKTVRIMIAVLTALSLCGCAKTDDDSLDKVKSEGKLVLGFDEYYPPMGFRDEEGNITGFDIDLAAEVCRRMGIELVPKPINWDSKEKELNSGSIDCIWNGLSVSAERAESMNLSKPYMNNDLIFVVKGAGRIRSVADLKGRTVGTQKGSSSETVLNASDLSRSFSVVYEDDNVTLLEKLEEGTVDAVFLDSIFAYYYISRNDKELYILPTVLETEKIAIGFRKGDDRLRDGVQEILHQMNSDGTLKKISDEWFDTDVTTVR